MVLGAGQPLQVEFIALICSLGSWSSSWLWEGDDAFLPSFGKHLVKHSYDSLELLSKKKIKKKIGEFVF